MREAGREERETRPLGLEPALWWQVAQSCRRRVAGRPWAVEHLPFQAFASNIGEDGLHLPKKGLQVDVLPGRQYSRFPRSTLQSVLSLFYL